MITISRDVIDAVTALVAAVAFVNSVRNSRAIGRQKSYSDLDSLYLDALKLGVAYPDLVDPEKTADYQNRFTGNDLHRYNAYAYIMWNICETIYDDCGSDKGLWNTWCPVIETEKTLHIEWFRNNLDRFKKRFQKEMGVF